MKKLNEVLRILKKNNKSAAQDKIRMYADAYMDYQEAAENIRENGAICAHPKTGAPMDNPYLKVRNQMRPILVKMRIKSDGLW